ncbi:MAG: hypothetical protein PHG96_03115 [Kiritimatiellae bacterium]|nr:hypothetical protein [Kiritimatiellia bacterium]
MNYPIKMLTMFLTASTVVLPLAVVSAATSFVREKAGSIWQDGLFIGDGATAAMVYAPMHLEWMINRNDVLDSRVFECDYLSHDKVMACVATNDGRSVAFLRVAERPSIKGPADGDRLTLSMSAAILRVRFWSGVGWSMPSIPATRQELDTRTGELSSKMTSPFLTPEALSFIERSRDVMVVDIGDPNAPERHAVIELARPEDPRLDALPFAWQVSDGTVSFTQKMPGGEDYAVALTAPGEVRTIGRTARLNASGSRTLFLAVRTTRDAADPRGAAVTAVKAAEKDGFAKVRSDNRAWWKKFWDKGARAVFSSEETIDTQWNYALYALASQFGRAPMPALNGLTYGPLDGGNAGIGSHCYVHDQNVQIPMMPFFPLNHAGFVKTFVQTYTDAMPELERRTKEVFGVRGAYLPLNMNQYGFEHPIADYRYTLCGGAYSGLVLAQAWWYSHDEQILREVYPLLKKFILFYTETMTRDEQGIYRFIWSVPPEIFTGTRDETATIACLKPCLEVAVEAATRFKCDPEERKLWKDILAHYPATAKHSEGGWWCGPEIPDDHYMYGGHLFYPFFPSEADTDVETAKKTLDYAWKYGVEISYETPEPHPVHEWSALYIGMATTRLYGGEKGWKALTDFYDGFAKPNGVFSHNPIIMTDLTREQALENVKKAPKLIRRNYYGKLGGYGRRGPNDLTYNPDGKALVAPVLEGGAAFLMLASEALCQSWGGEIRIFPSVPKNFSGRFENFRVRGGHTVSAEMKNGTVVDFVLKGASKGDKIKISCPTDPDFVQLPGEPAWKKPIGTGPFPDALSAFVFRNWTLVPAETLAAAVGATAADIRRIAAEMGLDPLSKVPSEWKRGGYVTILRRNWQILPYPQIMAVTGMSRKELRNALMYDDFLLSKMGSDKPAAEPIVYSADYDAAGRKARLNLKKILDDEGVKIVDTREEPRFAFMHRLAEVPETMKGGAKQQAGDARFQRKLIFPYCADYGDVLDDADAASCSEGLIARLAGCGVDALWFHVVLATLSTDPNYPEWRDEASRRRATLQKLVDRAAKYGVKIFLYINEPRSQPGSFFDIPGREGMRGAVEPRGAGYYAMCTEDPATLAWLEGSLKSLFTEVTGLGGVFTITMSETMTHCASAFKGPQQTCSKCKDKPYEYFVAKVNAAIVRGVKAGNPAAEVWYYDVGWEVDGVDERVIPMLPKDGKLLLWSEKYLPFEQAGKMRKVTEYSISHPGPGNRALGLWKAAADAGLGCVAKLQVSCSWELSSVPYLPTMDLVVEHAYNLSGTPVDSVMLSWSQGGYPSPNLMLFNEFRKGDSSEIVLDRVARKRYGNAADAVRAAWTAYSDGFRNYPIEWQTVYYAPVQMGPANLLYAKKTDWPATMVNTPYDDFERWSGGYADNRRGWIEQMRRCAEGFEKGDALWKDVVARCEGAAKQIAADEAVIFRAATLTLKTCVDQAEFILARDRGDKDEMTQRAAAECATAKEMLELVRRNSALGYEASNRYIYVPNDFLEKILNCHDVINFRPLFPGSLPAH